MTAPFDVMNGFVYIHRTTGKWNSMADIQGARFEMNATYFQVRIPTSRLITSNAKQLTRPGIDVSIVTLRLCLRLSILIFLLDL
jgi:hypothetical protein